MVRRGRRWSGRRGAGARAEGGMMSVGVGGMEEEVGAAASVRLKMRLGGKPRIEARDAGTASRPVRKVAR